MQAGAAAGSLVLVTIFVASSFRSDFVAGTAPDGGGGGPQPLGEEQRKELTAQAARFDEQLAAAPDSVDALEVCGCIVQRGTISSRPTGPESLTQAANAAH